jgi:hypothetical protein
MGFRLWFGLFLFPLTHPRKLCVQAGAHQEYRPEPNPKGLRFEHGDFSSSNKGMIHLIKATRTCGGE